MKASKKAPAAAPVPYHQQIGQMAAQGMSSAPSNELGMIGHTANLHENGMVAEPYAPGAYPTQNNNKPR